MRGKITDNSSEHQVFWQEMCFSLAMGSGKFAERAQNVLIIVYLIIMEPFFMSSR